MKINIKCLVIAIFFLLDCSSPEAPQSQGPTEDNKKSPQSQEKKEDKKKFLSFYNEILKRTTIIDKLYEPIPKALQRKDIMRAIKIAKQRKYKMNKEWLNLDRIKIPMINDNKVKKCLKEGKEHFSYAYLDKTDMVKDISRIGKQPDSFMDIATDIQIKSERFQQNLIIGLAKIMDAGAKLDIKAEELTKKK